MVFSQGEWGFLIVWWPQGTGMLMCCLLDLWGPGDAQNYVASLLLYTGGQAVTKVNPGLRRGDKEFSSSGEIRSRRVGRIGVQRTDLSRTFLETTTSCTRDHHLKTSCVNVTVGFGGNGDCVCKAPTMVQTPRCLALNTGFDSQHLPLLCGSSALGESDDLHC